jgi:glycosyltransferase involved in cell wall biosynthesis
VTVVMPAYNEFSTIRPVFARVTASALIHELIVVDDASTDGTGELLDEVVAAYEGPVEVRLLRQPSNRGKGAALRRGFEAAGGDIVLIQDADLEYDPADYGNLLSPILDGDADVVYGSRFTGSPRRVLRFWHAVANRFLTLLSNMVTNLNLTDMETGYKVFRTDVLRRIPIRSERFGFEPEITAKLARLQCRLYEVPISYHGRTYDEGKKIGLKDAFEAVWIILKYWLIRDVDSGVSR